jgi:hypothetical protein
LEEAEELPTSFCSPRDFHLPLPPDLRSRLQSLKERYDRLSPVSLRIPTTLPHFDGVFAVRSGLVLRLVSGWETRTLCLLGDSPGSCSWSAPGHEGSYAGNTTILHVAEELSGTRVAVIPFPTG